MKLNTVLLGITLSAVTYTVTATDPAPVFDVSNKSNAKTTSLSLSEQVAIMARKVSAQNRSQNKIQQQLDDLQNEINELRGVTELHTHQLSQVLNRQRELYQELDRRVSEALKPANSVPDTLVAPQSNQPATGYSADLSENDAYDRAVNMVLKEKRYDQAIPAFKAFNQKYPNSSYAANAHYWLGQLLFNKGELAQAKTEFSVVVEQFKDSGKRSDAMLKLAMVAQKQKRVAQAKSLYQQLITEYPNSSAAKLAQPRLTSLSQ